MEDLKQIKYNRLISELKKELNSLHLEHHDIISIDTYYNSGKFPIINISSISEMIIVDESFKSELPSDIVFDIILSYTGHRNYTIRWMK